MADSKNNTGYRNTGDWNTGDWNTGHRNTGYRNTGHRNTGHRNTGYSNTGHLNTGDRNTGDWNTGDRNTGDRNTGNWNTGYWNTCDYETGAFNTEQSENVRVFNKTVSREIWDKCEKPSCLYFVLTEWVADSDMTDQEKIDNETFHTTGGYLKSYEYQEAFKKSWDEHDIADNLKVKDLPNFDADIFLEISGIDVRDYDGSRKTTNPAVIVIDGATYDLRG